MPETPGSKRPKSRKRLRHETHVAILALVAAGPGVLIALGLVWFGDYSANARWTVTIFLLLFVWGGISALRHRVRFPLQTLSNLVAAIREGDFSTRARSGGSVDAMGELAAEINALANHLRGQRLDSVEAAALLRAVMSEIDVAVFAFDPQHRLTLANRSGERLLGRGAEQLLGRTAVELGLMECLEGEANRILNRAFPGGGDRWSMRRGTFRQSGVQNHLVVLTDLSRALRDEERQAWQRLLRVLGHEINNSLAPIKSISGSLEQLIDSEPKPKDWQDDLRSGLAVVSSRTAALTRFMEAYSKLAKLPPPRVEKVDLGPLIERVLKLEQRLPVELKPGPEQMLKADPDQLEQLLINLVRNAVEAVGESKRGSVTVSWTTAKDHIEIAVEDEGPGIASTANLFVPFFTTKPGGSGIGLALSRQIAEAHGGSLEIGNRPGCTGCIARVKLPID